MAPAVDLLPSRTRHAGRAHAVRPGYPRTESGGIETEPSYRLQCHFRGKLRRKAQRKKITGPLTNCTILGQVPSTCRIIHSGGGLRRRRSRTSSRAFTTQSRRLSLPNINLKDSVVILRQFDLTHTLASTMKSIQIRIFTGVSNRLLKAKCKEKHRQYVRQSGSHLNQFTVDAQVFPCPHAGWQGMRGRSQCGLKLADVGHGLALPP